jgi:hypothetical protein
MSAMRRIPTPVQILASGALGVGIMLLCLIPPGIHLITGPLGPGIGGFITGRRARATRREAWLIGLAMGLVFACLLALVFGGAELLSPGGFSLPVGGSALVVGLIALLAVTYVSLLGSGGAMIGGNLARAEQAS